MRDQSYEAEVLVVENGSTDRTLEIAQGYPGRCKNLRVLHEEGRGKGLAVRRGMLEARGEYRFMCDADLSMPIEEVNKFLPPKLPASTLPSARAKCAGAVRYDEPFYRHFGGRFINYIIRLLILPQLQDTQCGFKCFRAEVAEELFGRQLLNGWSFDIEVLYLAERARYKIVEIPINWYYRTESKVSAVRDAVRMIQRYLPHPCERCGRACTMRTDPDLSFEQHLWQERAEIRRGVGRSRARRAGRAGGGGGGRCCRTTARGSTAAPAEQAGGVRNSKQMTTVERETASRRSRNWPWRGAVGFASSDEIDSEGIVAATRLAALRAVEQLALFPDYLLTDFRLELPELDIPQTALVQGRCEVPEHRGGIRAGKDDARRVDA